jgi:hypothetical protein
MPKKNFYTTGDLTAALGVSWGQLRYAIEQGRIPDASKRDASGHRLWSETEVGAVVAFFTQEVPRDRSSPLESNSVEEHESH